MDVEPRTVESNGITLAYRAWGPEDVPPVLLLHCRGADGADWTRIAQRLADGPRPRRVYAPGLRGHGGSTWPGERPGAYTHEAMRAVPGQPDRRDVALDSAEAMSGRGLHLLDLLTDHWTVEPSPLGKQIRCRLRAE